MPGCAAALLRGRRASWPRAAPPLPSRVPSRCSSRWSLAPPSPTWALSGHASRSAPPHRRPARAALRRPVGALTSDAPGTFPKAGRPGAGAERGAERACAAAPALSPDRAGPEPLCRRRLCSRHLAPAAMSATVEREFEELDAQCRWQPLYLVSRWPARRLPSSGDPGSRPPAPSRLPRSCSERKWRRAGRVRGAPAPTAVGPLLRKRRGARPPR